MSYRFPFPYVPNSLLVMVGGTVQPATEIDPADPEGGTFDIPDDPEDMTVRAYARVSPDAVPTPPTDEDLGMDALEDVDDDYDEDDDQVDAEDDEAEETDPDAPEYPDD